MGSSTARRWRRIGVVTAVATLAASGAVAKAYAGPPPGTGSTATPIKHLVVIFQENVSFDHYFGTYPNATNTHGQPFVARPGTPTVNGLSAQLLSNNPNLANPQRLNSAQAATCDQDHGYTSEQSAFDHGLMDAFVQDTGRGLTQQCLAAEGNRRRRTRSISRPPRWLRWASRTRPTTSTT